MSNEPSNEPGKAVLTILDTLIDNIKSSVPQRSDGKDLYTGVVYSQLTLGELVDPDDYKRAWSPMKGSSVQDSVKAQGGTPGAPAVAAGEPTPGAPAASEPDPKYKRAIDAAFKTSQLVDRLLMVTEDETMREYPGGGRKISFAYESIINGMQAPPAPPMPPELEKQLEAARKVLYEADDDGDLLLKSKLFKRYEKNAMAYAKAKKDFAEAQAEALADPAKADTWPQTAAFYQRQVDEAWDTWKSEGADKVEKALDIIQSIGVNLQDRMIAKSRKIFDAWNLQLAGVPVATPYSYISPSSWAEPDGDDDGWQSLKFTSTHYSNHTGKNSHYFQQGSSHSDSSSTSGGGGFSFFGFGASGGGGKTSTHESSQGSQGGETTTFFRNDAKDLTIELEYGLCDVNRPWFLGDLFYMKNWYMVNNKKNAISNGTVQGQNDTLLPMIPMRFLVVRNLRISSKNWGEDGATLRKYFGSAESGSSSSTVEGGGGLSFGFGPFSLNASAKHSNSQADSHSSANSSSSERGDYEAHFVGDTLEIKGAQIMAWLSTVVPACAPEDDPGLKDQATSSQPAQPTTTTQPAASTQPSAPAVTAQPSQPAAEPQSTH